MFVGNKVGPFEIEKELGSGAMGTVYRAKYDKDGKVLTVALKVVALGLLGNEGAMARFEREADILKQLRHPNIVRLFATGRYKQTPFIAMEYVDGDPMDRLLTRRGKFGWEDVITYGRQLCDALQCAHEKGIIHRDLKPSNLMVTRDGVLKLADFGIAKDTDVTALTGANSTIGTAAYMSPEQCRGDRNLSHKSDLYSLGVVFYELVTGKKPFNSETSMEMFLKHVNEIAVKPSRFVADLPVWLDNLIMFLLEKDVDRRPFDAATVGRMLADIEEKVRSQHSAAADVANARKMDRPLAGAELTAADVDAAREIRASIRGKKGKKKKKATPLFQRQWVRAVPVIVLLLGVVGLVVWLLKPPGRDELAKAVEFAGSPETRITAAQRYLDRYGTETDDQTEKVRSGLKEARGKLLEAVLDKRFRNRNGGLKITKAQDNESEEAHDAAWQALEFEEKGDLGGARLLWEKVRGRGAEVTDRYAVGWQWYAEKHLADIQSLDKLLAGVKDDLARGQQQEAPWKYDPADPKLLAAAAVRLSGVPLAAAAFDPTAKPLPPVTDPAKARRTWDALYEYAKDKPEHRNWWLLAGRERGKYPETKTEPALADRKVMLAGVLAKVRELWAQVATRDDEAGKQRDCRTRARDVVELYADETDDGVKRLVESAKTLLAAMTAPRG